jgi:hypothetical protein
MKRTVFSFGREDNFKGGLKLRWKAPESKFSGGGSDTLCWRLHFLLLV